MSGKASFKTGFTGCQLIGKPYWIFICKAGLQDVSYKAGFYLTSVVTRISALELIYALVAWHM